MPDFNKILQTLKETLGKLDTTRQIILGAVVLTFIGALIAVVSISSTKTEALLFKNMETSDFAGVTSKLQEMNYPFSTSGTDAIFVDPEKRDEIIMALAQEKLIPQGVHGWEIFDEDKWTETQFEKDIKAQRALMGSISRMLSRLKGVERATVNIAFPDEELFADRVQPVTASVLLHYAPGVENLKRKEIEGIVTLVSRATPKLNKKDVSVAGPDGEILNDYDNEIDKAKWELKEVTEKLKIEDKERLKLLSDIGRSLDETYPDRSAVLRLNVQLRWDKEQIDQHEVSPVVMVPDNPVTPYSELEVKDSLEVSSRKTTETFQGNGFTPEGPAGAEPNIPPGYKDRDYQKATYEKKEDIKNNEFNKTHRTITKQPWEIDKINLAVLLDGRWAKKGEKEDGSGYIREYTPVSDDEVADLTDLLKKAIGYSVARGDQISVKHIQKDRSAEFEAEDEALRRSNRMRKMLMATVILLLVVVAATILIQMIRKEMERRRRKREAEEAAQRELMYDAALRAIDEQGVEVELSIEEKARKEMLENAVNLAKDRPEEVAQLIRTWLAEE